jgi:hypothetical protein
MVIVCSTLQEPLELTAVSRYVVVVLGVTVRLPLVPTGFPLSSTWAALEVDHWRMLLSPAMMLLVVAVKELIVGQLATVTVTDWVAI